MESIAWMAWTPATALFFGVIAGLLALMTVLALRAPEVERVGVLGLATTRGDRLFISLLGAAFIHLGAIALYRTGVAEAVWTVAETDVPRLWIATLISLVYAGAVFRWV